MAAKVFLPFSEELLEELGAPPGKLVPFHLEYQCVRLLEDGTEEPITEEHAEPELACTAPIS